jgi:hypothetical protein
MGSRSALAGSAAFVVSVMLVAGAAGGVRATGKIAASPPKKILPTSSFTGTGPTGGLGSSGGFEGSEGSEGFGASGESGRDGSGSFQSGGASASPSPGPGGAISGLGVTAVRRLQTALARLGYFRHSVTGYYGPITTRAVKRFQRSAGLKPDGIWGPLSAAALARRLAR